ncbi:AEC family transporter [Aestuariispira insulae]|uniref:AEC family transporter n=1 Tax=Aestuariispira insulae TaxID=1461337 RepID=A0A3D9H5P3_9PROT|nr:AEC family transporter [Aestuariispira insulae]RED44825.1 hypothetical protein DFP90_11330 [Aestuariispira insulae]
MLAIAESLLPVFALIGLGLVLRRQGIVPENQWDGLNKVCYWLFFPMMLAKTMVGADLDNVPLGGMAGAMLTASIIMGILAFALKPVFIRGMGLDGAAFTSVFQTSVRWNGFIALAIVLKLFDEQGIALVAVAMAVLVPIINIACIFVLAAYSSNEPPSAGRIALNIIKNPILLGCVGGLLLNRLHIPVWDPVLTLMDLLGRSALGAGLLCIGAGLKVRHLVNPSGGIWVSSLIKLGLTPLVVGGAAVFFGLRGDALEVAVLCAAVPTAMNGYVLARQMGGDAELYAASTTLQTLISLISIPLFLVLAAKLVAFL